MHTPERHESVHQLQNPGSVMPFTKVDELMHQDVFKALGWLLRKREIQPDALRVGVPNDPDPDARILVGFRTVKVFDVSQTDGEPLPERPQPELLRDTPEALAKLRDLDRILIAWCATQGVRVTHDLQYPHALGVYRHTHQEIALRPDLSTVQSFKTLVHEVAHHLLHTREDERHTAELEAEATAFLVCDALGVDTGSYSFAYLAHWQKTLDELLHAGERASRAARTILGAVGRAQEHPLAHASGED